MYTLVTRVIREFWERKIWGDADRYKGRPHWLGDVEKTYRNIKEQEWIPINATDISNQLRSAMNWKAPGHDKIPNFWLKCVPSLYGSLAFAMNSCVEQPDLLPDWLVKGKTTLLPKSPKTNDASQYRPITCLTNTWKCLTGIIGEKIASFMNANNMLAVEQQGAIKKSYGTKTQLLINKNILADAARRKRNLHMLYIDYSKAYDSVPHAWIKESLSVYKISPTIISFICSSMQKWVVDLTLTYDGGCILVENVRFLRGIFQGDSLSPLIFIIALNPLSLIINRQCRGYKIGEIWISHLWYMDDLKGYTNSYESLCLLANLIDSLSTDIGMEFGLSKCKCINMVGGRYKQVGSIQLQSGGIIEEIEPGGFYKYLGVEELDSIKHEDIKAKVKRNVKGKMRKLLETELNARNLFQAINESILPLITYSFGVVHWNENELKGLDVQIRKMLNMYRVHELLSDVDRLYLPRETGGRGLLSIWDSFQSSTSRIAHSFLNTDNVILEQCIPIEQMCHFSNITRANKYESSLSLELPKNFHEKTMMNQARIKASLVKSALIKARANSLLAKPQHGAYFRLLEESNANMKGSMAWLKKCFLDAHTESYICAAQEMALITKFHEKHILKNGNDDRCRMCKKDPESIFHILGACDVLAKQEYFTRHNNICRYLHYKILEHYKMEVGKNWYRHDPPEVVIGKDVEIIYDQVIMTTRPIGANRPDIIVKDKIQKKTYIIDVACPVDTNICKKESEKISKYGGLRVELERMWGADADIIPVIVGGLGALSNNFNNFLAKIPDMPDPFMCQKIGLLGSKRILTDVLKRRQIP